MAHEISHRRVRLVIVDRAGLSGSVEAVCREQNWPVEIVACSSALEVVGENGPGVVEGLMVSVGASGPFVADLLRWSEANMDRRIPTMIIGAGGEQDESAARMSLAREHVRWFDREPGSDRLREWISRVMEVFYLRAFRTEHERIAAALREARMQVFHGFVPSYAPPPEVPPCGPPLPTNVDEIQALKDARAQFERAHIKSAVREWGSLKDASAALGISYTSLWRRLR